MKKLFALIILSGCGFGNGEEGWHRGHVVDVSRSGWICKTREAEIMSGSGNSAIKYNLTITNDEAFNLLVEAQKTEHEVNVHYESPRIFSLCGSFHGTKVDKAEILK